MSLNLISEWSSFGGRLSVHEHESQLTQCPMRFAVFEPPLIKQGPVPVLWYLSGLTCTWANVMEKSGIMAHAAEQGMLVVAPDTSPRGAQVADHADYDLGQGAGFYLTATQAPWTPHYKMDSYLLTDLSLCIEKHFNVNMERQGIMGHSMGGHGAITLHLKHPSLYKSCSALAPIVSPSQVPWGQKALKAYLGEDLAEWEQYDASALVRKNPSKATLLIDQGAADPFLSEQLQPDAFLKACELSGQQVQHRMHQGYDHSYYFIASMIKGHVAHHARALTSS